MSWETTERNILVTCPLEIPPLLRREIEALGLPIREELATGVMTRGSMLDAMRLNLHLRTGYRVLYHLKTFRAADPEELYDQIASIAWEDWIDPDGYVSVVSSVQTPSIRDSRFANMRVKDALVDRMNHVHGRRPDSGPATDRAVIFLWWHDEDAAIYLDTSGDPLSRRGYRRIPWKAPMHEALAAAIVMQTGWDGETSIVNPMCGSGTLAIEAALIATRRPPGSIRQNFAFMHLRGFDPQAWRRIREEGKKGIRRQIEGTIIASDISSDAVAAARRNAATAGVDHLIDFHVCDFAATPVPEGGDVVVMNPEYGERLGDVARLEATYERIGDFLKRNCAGYRGYVFTGSPRLAKRIGLRTSRRIPLHNSTIECRLLEYELYEGTRRDGRDAADT